MTEPLDLDKIRIHISTWGSLGVDEVSELADELEATRTRRADWEKMCDETATVRDAAVEALKVAATELEACRAERDEARAALADCKAKFDRAWHDMREIAAAGPERERDPLADELDRVHIEMRTHISDLVDAEARIAAAHAAQILDDLECGLVRWTDNPDLIVEGIGRRIGVWRRMLAQEKADNDRP